MLLTASAAMSPIWLKRPVEVVDVGFAFCDHGVGRALRTNEQRRPGFV